MELPKKLSDLKIVKKGEISEDEQHLARATLTSFSHDETVESHLRQS